MGMGLQLPRAVRRDSRKAGGLSNARVFMAFGWSGEVLDESPDATEKDAPSQGTCVGTPSFELHSLCGWSGHHSLVICIQQSRGSEALSNTERQQVHIYGPGKSSRSQFVRHADSNESI